MGQPFHLGRSEAPCSQGNTSPQVGPKKELASPLGAFILNGFIGLVSQQSGPGDP